jgi:hypothetical protein
MTDTGSHADTRDIYMVHTTFRREFGALPSLVRNVPAGDIQRSQTIGDHIDILGIYLYAHHHSEDIHLWPKLLDRGPREVAPIVHLMESQHENIERLNAEADEATDAWRADPRPRKQRSSSRCSRPVDSSRTYPENSLRTATRSPYCSAGARSASVFFSFRARLRDRHPHRSGAVMRSLRDHGPSFAEHSPRTRNAPNTEPGPRTFPA